MNDYFSKCCLIIFTRNLIPGEVNTSLVNEKGEEEAFRIYAALEKQIRELAIAFPVAKHLYYDRFINEQDEWNHYTLHKKLQQTNNPGEQKETAFQNAFEEGYRKVILINCDYGMLTPKHLEEAFLSLKIIEYCIGPDTSGNYYLIGMNQFEPIIFNHKDWNANNLYKLTVRDIGSLKFAIYKLPTLSIYQLPTEENK